MMLDDVETGTLFGGSDEILAVTSSEEHAYNVQTVIWLLPETGKPRRLLTMNGTIDGFMRTNERGVWMNRQMYDGIDPSTKRKVREFWKWDSNQQTLTLRP